MAQATLFDRVNPEPVEGELVPYARGSHTSWRAAQRVNPGQRQTRTQSYLRLLSERGPTIDETAAGLLRCKQSSICSIRHGLITRQPFPLIRPEGEQVAPLTGERCTAWTLTDEGRQTVER